ncbi:RWD-domain-containing protein [Durotheca rogersii]|uniref:RWD-domain-containing protein n=1 Tax=Durotheca rogersii TaxID=419775 RepID=UPI00221FC28C|nr:RWD-domain-containing protein [Durotheca rogersii]KAI5865031.1 RWD-domain-containing protein [Durotheca rogersii]
MGKEEQAEEREVLASIFPDEITDISDSEFRIAIKLDLPDDDSDAAAGASEPPTLILHVQYPEAYPDEAPVLDLLPAAGAAPHPEFSVGADKGALLAGVEAAVRESLGMAMVFTVVTAVKEAAEQLVASRRAAAAAARDEAARAAERAENQKFHGDPVTPASFARWRDAFRREMDERRARDDEDLRLADAKRPRAAAKEPPRLTGRQLWERGLAGRGDEAEAEVDPDDDPDVPTERVGKLKVEE